MIWLTLTLDAARGYLTLLKIGLACLFSVAEVGAEMAWVVIELLEAD